MQPIQNKLLDMAQSEVAQQELSALIDIHRDKAQAWSGKYGRRDDALASQIPAIRTGFGDVRFGVYRD